MLQAKWFLESFGYSQTITRNTRLVIYLDIICSVLGSRESLRTIILENQNSHGFISLIQTHGWFILWTSQLKSSPAGT